MVLLTHFFFCFETGSGSYLQQISVVCVCASGVPACLQTVIGVVPAPWGSFVKAKGIS